MSTRCQILLPGLFDLPLTELSTGLIERQLPNLNRLLRYASVLDNHLHTIDASVAGALGWEIDRSYCLPVAQAFIDESENKYLLVEAVHLHADLQNAILVPIDKSQEYEKDFKIIINDLNDMFKVDFHIDVTQESTCLMRLETLAAPEFYPHPLSVLGKPVNAFVEQSRNVLPWYRLLNEIQMFLFQHPVNHHRQVRGLLSINSLWCWGGGAPVSRDYSYDWYCDDPTLNRFAESLGMNPKPVDRLESASGKQQSIVVDLRLLEATKSVHETNLEALLLDIESTVLGPSIKRFDGSLRLRSDCETDLVLLPWSRLKFWRRQQNLAEWQRRLQAQFT